MTCADAYDLRRVLRVRERKVEKARSGSGEEEEGGLAAAPRSVAPGRSWAQASSGDGKPVWSQNPSPRAQRAQGRGRGVPCVCHTKRPTVVSSCRSWSPLFRARGAHRRSRS
ncbi:hypothetical protein NDU88_006602 [Pleurodeles waltl]|uniref:Uncharacterized protein n=1 Tax=Pleurodeles waltl TaxID=8319 RepID=A0AAV7L4A1_PLEWA|nr:hypothetical protein NDU88_006602 [Pleurodeles waltl]